MSKSQRSARRESNSVWCKFHFTEGKIKTEEIKSAQTQIALQKKEMRKFLPLSHQGRVFQSMQ